MIRRTGLRFEHFEKCFIKSGNVSSFTQPFGSAVRADPVGGPSSLCLRKLTLGNK